MFGNDVKFRLSSVPLSPMFVRFMLETDLEYLSHVIPSQVHELLPLPDHEDSKAWLWFSRLAFHFSKAHASLFCNLAKTDDDDAVKEELATCEDEDAIMNVQKHIRSSTQKGTSRFML